MTRHSSSVKALSALAIPNHFCSVDAVNNFDNGDGRERVLDLTESGLDPLDHLLYSFAAPLAGDQNAGVQDQAQD